MTWGPLAGLTSLTNLNVSYNYTATNAGALNALTNMAELYRTDIWTERHHVRIAHAAPDQAGLRLLQCDRPFAGAGTESDCAVGLRQPAHERAAGDQLHHPDGAPHGRYWSTNVSSFGRLTALYELTLDNNPGIANLSFLNGLTNLTFLSAGQLPVVDERDGALGE